MKFVKRFTDAVTSDLMKLTEVILTLIFIALLSGCGKLSTLGHSINTTSIDSDALTHNRITTGAAAGTTITACSDATHCTVASNDAPVPTDEQANVFDSAATQLNAHDQLVCGSVLLVADRFSMTYTQFLLHASQTGSDFLINTIIEKTIQVMDQEEQNLPADQKPYFDMGYSVVVQFVTNVTKLRPVMKMHDNTNYINPTDFPPAVTQWCNGSLAHLNTPFVYEGALTIPYNLSVK